MLQPDILDEAMQRALTLAKRSPAGDVNPQVGCVILDPEGRIIAEGTHDELGRLVGEMDRIDLSLDAPAERVLPAWRAVPEVAEVVAEGDGQLALLAQDSNVVLPRLFEAANGAGVRITSVTIQEPNLETVFLHLTGRALRD